MKLSTLLLTISICSLAHASTTCQSTFHAGNGNGQAVINFCVTENGNIASLNGQINGAEGYAVCGIGPGYWDLGSYGDSGNWLPAVITQPGGPNTFPLTITRSSADGLITLTQAFTFGSGKASVHVKMTLTGGRAYAMIARYADVQLTPGLPEHGDYTHRSSFVWNSTAYGLTAKTSPSPLGGGGLMFGGPPSTNLCDTSTWPSVPYTGDSATELGWTVPNTKPFVAAFDYVPMR